MGLPIVRMEAFGVEQKRKIDPPGIAASMMQDPRLGCSERGSIAKLLEDVQVLDLRQTDQIRSGSELPDDLGHPIHLLLVSSAVPFEATIGSERIIVHILRIQRVVKVFAIVEQDPHVPLRLLPIGGEFFGKPGPAFFALSSTASAKEDQEEGDAGRSR
jgi:hypothetical protein